MNTQLIPFRNCGRCSFFLRTFGFFFILLLGKDATSLAQANPIPVTEIRTLYPSEKNVRHVSGLAYARSLNLFYLIKEKGQGEGLTITAMSPYEDLLATTRLERVKHDEMNVVFDDQHQRLLIYSRDSAEIVQIAVDAQGVLALTQEARLSLKGVAPKRAEGMAIDPTGQHLFLLDNNTQQLLRVDLDNGAQFRERQFTQINLAALGKRDLHGLAFHPSDGHLYALGFNQQLLYKLTLGGQLVATYDLSALKLNDPQGLVFAPSSDRTDPAETIHLFIADRGRMDKKRYGHIVEVALTPASSPSTQIQSAAANGTLSLFLVQTLNLAQQSPPSPDPSGIAYIPTTNRLFVSDGEVDEIPALFTGNNLYELTLPGALARTGTTLPYSDEPTGVAYNANNGHLFLSDDDLKKVFELTAGPDALFGTSDDTVTSFGTAIFNSFDPEGLALDAANNTLYIVDGVNNEVYVVRPGANGLFDGVPALGGDDVVTNFDVLALGIQDPEGIEYDTATGNLVIAGRADRELYEVTTTGLLSRILSIADTNPDKLAGVAMAPGSQNPGVINYYVADRGIDNDIDPTENDGKVYEFTLTPAFGDLFISPRDNGAVGGVAYKDEDILSYDTDLNKWALFFDGSDVGVTTDVDAFDILDDGSVLLSFEIDTLVAGLGLVDDGDIVRFIPASLGATTSGVFEWYLDGSDVELTTDSEDIDAVGVVNGSLVLSMLGDPVVTGVSGARDEDLLVFTPTQLGETSAGTWSLYFDGSDVGLSDTNDEDVQGVHIDTSTNNIYLSAKGVFSVNGVSGDGGDIFICTPITLGDSTSCTFSPFWDGAAHGFGNGRIDAIELISAQAMSSIVHQVGQITTGPNPPEENPVTEPNDTTDEEPDETGGQSPSETGDHLVFLPMMHR